MRGSKFAGRFIVVSVVAALLAFQVGGPVLAGPGARFGGRVYGDDGRTPLAGVRVVLVNPSSGATFPSPPTDRAGFFWVDGAPAGTYAVEARTPDGSFLAADAVTLHQGENPPVSLSLKPGRAPAAVAGLAPAQMPNAGAGQKLKAWQKGAMIGGITLAALLLLDEVTSESEASPF